MDLHRFEFESRIFISFLIVITICVLSFTVFSDVQPNIVLIGRTLGFSTNASIRIGYFAVSLFMIIASFIRIWSGSILTSKRMMRFRVQVDKLIRKGPYLSVRNPIYLADLIAFSGFALCLPHIGFLLPLFLYIHYIRIIKYEEKSLITTFSNDYKKYMSRIPRLLPNYKSLSNIRNAFQDLEFTKDGIRHNSLYLLFIPGFITSGITYKLIWAVIIGLPAVIDWAIVHTKIGVGKDQAGDNLKTIRGKMK